LLAGPKRVGKPLSVTSLFSGIGGIELGLRSAGHHTEFQCELSDAARAVLRHHFVGCVLRTDITKLRSIPTVDLVSAGFPCQDLSQAGKTEGIRGSNSSLISYVFDLIRKKRTKPEWILIENVPFMLQLERGDAMRHLTSEVQALGYNWAYRVVDARSFGLPQRRRRVLFLASLSKDPRQVLFADDVRKSQQFSARAGAHGFYWTEGNNGLGWTDDGVPTLKGGSSLGIPSPPGIWLRETNEIVTPDIRDAERLQGFPVNWTHPAITNHKKVGIRWKLVGNAVSVPVARWVGKRLAIPKTYESSGDTPLATSAPWPNAAWSVNGMTHRAAVSEWPKHFAYRSLESFLKFPVHRLSERATAGFLRRIRASTLRRPEEFDAALQSHLSSRKKDAILS
jgi:DNA (cytosine-5)-methyltransferase 1